MLNLCFGWLGKVKLTRLYFCIEELFSGCQALKIYIHFFIQSLPIDITIVNICDHFDTVVDLLDVTSVLDGGEKGSSQDCTFVSKYSFQDFRLS